MTSIQSLAKRISAAEGEILAGAIGGSGIPAWTFVLSALSLDHLRRLEGMNDEQLKEFIFGENTDSILWQIIMAFHQIWEDQLYGGEE